MISICFGILFALMKHIQLSELNISNIATINIVYKDDLVDELNILDGVFVIGPEAFKSWSSLIKVTIGNDAWVIGDGAFMNCNKIREVNFGFNIMIIGKNAFTRCYDLEKLNFPAGLFLIGEAAFDSCYSIQQLIIPDEVPQISSNAFKKCISLKSVVIGSHVRVIESLSFSSCINLFNIELPDSLEIIETHAFLNCVSLKKINFGNLVSKFHPKVFMNCNSLEHINVSDNNRDFSNYQDDGVIYDKRISSIIYFPEGKRSENYVVPQSIISIKEDAFNSCNNLKSIQMNSNLKRIDNAAFEGCNGLTELILENIEYVGLGAFKRCTNLKVVFMGKNIQYIGEYAFSQCISLRCFYYSGNKEPKIENNAFSITNFLTIVVTNSYIGNTFGKMKVFKGKAYGICPPTSLHYMLWIINN